MFVSSTTWTHGTLRTLTTGQLRLARCILSACKAFYEVLYRVPDIMRQDVEASLNLVKLMLKPHEEIVAWSQVESIGLSELKESDLRDYLVSATSLLTKIEHIAEEIHAQALMGETVQRDPLESGDRSGESRAGGEIPARSGPGVLSLDRTARHDNDFEDYRKISLLPTEEEIYSKLQDFLPRDGCEGKTFCGPQNFLPHGTLRLFDKHFRLLRHDFLSQVRRAVNAFVGFLRDNRASQTEPGGQMKMDWTKLEKEERAGNFTCITVCMSYRAKFSNWESVLI
mmetsp:Transcript_6683/g.9715  ORF Transcript_6683/g.9715 Transcript_6683/m.9715 type:complete len:283 (-) Transcript_6683:2276-3124(-)